MILKTIPGRVSEALVAESDGNLTLLVAGGEVTEASPSTAAAGDPEQPVKSIWPAIVGILSEILMDFLADCGKERTQDLRWYHTWAMRRKVRERSEIPSEHCELCVRAMKRVTVEATPEEFEQAKREGDSWGLW